MGVEMQNCPLTRVFVKRASTGLLLFQWIYVSSLSLCHFLVSRHPSLCVFCFPLFILPVPHYFYFISVYATKSHFSPSSVLLPLFSFNSLYKFVNLCSLYTTLDPWRSYFLSPVPPFYPFLVSVLLSYCPMPPHLCRPCNICTASIYSLPYIPWWLSNVTKCNLGELNTGQCWPVVSTTNRMWGSLGL